MNTKPRDGVGLAHPTVVPENFDPETGTVRGDADDETTSGR